MPEKFTIEPSFSHKDTTVFIVLRVITRFVEKDKQIVQVTEVTEGGIANMDETTLNNTRYANKKM